MEIIDCSNYIPIVLIHESGVPTVEFCNPPKISLPNGNPYYFVWVGDKRYIQRAVVESIRIFKFEGIEE